MLTEIPAAECAVFGLFVCFTVYVFVFRGRLTQRPETKVRGLRRFADVPRRRLTRKGPELDYN